MALQTSGAISLNDIHVEAGGTSGTLVSINDSDIRGLISKASGATMSFNEWYGASANLGTFTITTGSQSSPYAGAVGFSLYNGIASGAFGSIASPSTFTDSNGLSRSVVGLYRVGATGNYYSLEIQLSGNSTTGFASLIIDLNGTTYTLPRTGTSTFYDSTDNYTEFKWDTNGGYFASGTTANSDLFAEFPGPPAGVGLTKTFELV